MHHLFNFNSLVNPDNSKGQEMVSSRSRIYAHIKPLTYPFLFYAGIKEKQNVLKLRIGA
jgi:hypothetical protein